MSKHISFLKEAIKDWRSTGSIVRSSPELIKKMLQPILFDKVELIVELGAGQGCITKALADSLVKNTHLLAFELNDHFLEEHIRSLHFENRRCIVSFYLLQKECLLF